MSMSMSMPPSGRTLFESIQFGNTGTMQSTTKGPSPGSQGPGLRTSAAKVRSSVSSGDRSTSQLLRTTLQRSPSPTTTSVNPRQDTPFNPNAMDLSRAVLKIDGNLDDMVASWSQEEWEAKRRIVLFRRSQSGSTITTQFEPVAIDRRPPNSRCISCIWWEEKKECFVTSVDIVYLLEALVGVQFTVEEKGRIRCNLRKFRALIVSKADSEDFFKTITDFPDPKPRIKKVVVRVFPWKNLAHTLEKMIGRYEWTLAVALLPRLTFHSLSAIHQLLEPLF
jgi:hypothetical protein